MTRIEFLATFILQYGHSLGTERAIQEALVAALVIFGDKV